MGQGVGDGGWGQGVGDGVWGQWGLGVGGLKFLGSALFTG